MSRYKKLSKSKKRKRIPGIDFHIAQLRAQLDPIENARVDYKLMRQGFCPTTLSTSRPLDRSTSQPLDLST
jgi:transcription elongation GreA/GreB family factor